MTLRTIERMLKALEETPMYRPCSLCETPPSRDEYAWADFPAEATEMRVILEAASARVHGRPCPECGRFGRLSSGHVARAMTDQELDRSAAILRTVIVKKHPDYQPEPQDVQLDREIEDLERQISNHT